MNVKALTSALALVTVAFASGADPVVSNVRAIQLQDGAGAVRITYDLAADTGSALHVGVEASSDGGLTWTVPMNTQSLSGNGYGAAVSPGPGKVISWGAVADWPGKVTTAMRFRVTASDTPPAPAGMALIPAGSFSMGDSPGQAVSVNAFHIDKYEVTKALWDEVANWAAANGYDINASSASGKAANHPAYYVTWYECVKWCNARSQRAGIVPCYTVNGAVYKTGSNTPDCNFLANGYRLPTEAEWEKAARGGLSWKRFPWGDTISHSQANYHVYSIDGITNLFSYDVSPTKGYHPTYATRPFPHTSPVGSFAPNGYGLYDMSGNVSEWCWDWIPNGYYGDSFRPHRGGGWGGDDGGGADDCRTWDRGSTWPYKYFGSLGFRSARSSVP